MLATVADATLPDSAPAAMKTGAPLPGDARGGTEPAEAPAPEAAQPEQPAAAADQPADAAASHEKTADAEATEEAPEQPEEQQPELEGADALPGLMDTGRKHFTLQNWEGAVQVFGKAAEIAYV